MSDDGIAPHRTPPLCTVSDKIKLEMRDGKYPQRGRSRGPRTLRHAPQDPDDLAEGPPSFNLAKEIEREPWSLLN
jgi:hypothetical protein